MDRKTKINENFWLHLTLRTRLTVVGLIFIVLPLVAQFRFELNLISRLIPTMRSSTGSFGWRQPELVRYPWFLNEVFFKKINSVQLQLGHHSKLNNILLREGSIDAGNYFVDQAAKHLFINSRRDLSPIAFRFVVNGGQPLPVRWIGAHQRARL